MDCAHLCLHVVLDQLQLWEPGAGKVAASCVVQLLIASRGVAGRARDVRCTLQASVLKLWVAEREGKASPGKTKEMASAVAAANAAASLGKYQGPHPSITSGDASLRETYRGWRTDM